MTSRGGIVGAGDGKLGAAVMGDVEVMEVRVQEMLLWRRGWEP